MHQAVEPPGEARTDYETLCALAERLGRAGRVSRKAANADELGAALSTTRRAGDPGREGAWELPVFRGVLGGRPGRAADAAAAARRLDFAALRAGSRGLRRCPRPRARYRARLGHDRGLRLRRLPGTPGLDGARRVARVGISLAASRCTSFPTSPSTRTALPSTTNGSYSQDSKVSGREPDPAASGGLPAPRAGSPTATVVRRVQRPAAPVLRERCSTPNLRRSVVQLSTGCLVGSRLAGATRVFAGSPRQPQRADAGQGHLAPGAGAQRRRDGAGRARALRRPAARRSRAYTAAPSCSRTCREGSRSPYGSDGPSRSNLPEERNDRRGAASTLGRADDERTAVLEALRRPRRRSAAA